MINAVVLGDGERRCCGVVNRLASSIDLLL